MTDEELDKLGEELTEEVQQKEPANVLVPSPEAEAEKLRKHREREYKRNQGLMFTEADRAYWEKLRATDPANMTKEEKAADVASIIKTLGEKYEAMVAMSGRKLVKDAYTVEAIKRAACWIAGRTKPWLVLYGGIGTGKTTLAKAIKATMASRNEFFNEVECNELSDLYMTSEGDYSFYAGSIRLVVDDLGAEPPTVKKFGNAKSPVGDMIMARYRHLNTTNCITIFTTNLSEDEIAERYGMRVQDRLHEVCEFINYNPNQKSYRQC